MNDIRPEPEPELKIPATVCMQCSEEVLVRFILRDGDDEAVHLEGLAAELRRDPLQQGAALVEPSTQIYIKSGFLNQKKIEKKLDISFFC